MGAKKARLNARTMLIRPLKLNVIPAILSKSPRTNVSYFPIGVVIPPTTRNRISNCLADFVARNGSQALQRGESGQAARARREWEDRVEHVGSITQVEVIMVATEGCTGSIRAELYLDTIR